MLKSAFQQAVRTAGILRGPDNEMRSKGCAAIAGHFAQMPLSGRLLQMVYGLSAVEEDMECVVYCLRRAEIMNEVEVLEAVSMQSVNILRNSACTEQILEMEVTSVHNALHSILQQCAQRSIGQQLLKDLTGMTMPAVAEDMRAFYERSPSAFVEEVAVSMEAVNKAATEALDSEELPLPATSIMPF